MPGKKQNLIDDDDFNYDFDEDDFDEDIEEEEEDIEEEEEDLDDFDEDIEEEEEADSDDLRDPVFALPGCFAQLFHTSASSCPHLGCALRESCRSASSGLIGSPKSVSEGSAEAAPVTPAEQGKSALFDKFCAALTSRFWLNQKSQYYSVVLNGTPDKHPTRYLRAFPGKRGHIKVTVPPSLAELLEADKWDVTPFTEKRAACFRPHVAAIFLRDEDRLEDFMGLFFKWANARDFTPLAEKPADYRNLVLSPRCSSCNGILGAGHKCSPGCGHTH